MGTGGVRMDGDQDFWGERLTDWGPDKESKAYKTSLVCSFCTERLRLGMIQTLTLHGWDL